MNASAPSANAALSDWLQWLEAGRRGEVLLGLERVSAVAGRLQLRPIPTITVAGTNGKGSCAHFAQQLAVDCGLRTALYTSPHLCDFSERMVIGGQQTADADICRAFAAVEAVRDKVPLTYFEHTTLAALWLFSQGSAALQILEVGLGGRLDAVNIVDADVAVITSIGRDHTRELGDTLEAIAAEKAGVARRGRPAIVASPNPPAALLSALKAIGADCCVAPQAVSLAASTAWSIPGIADALPAPYAGGPALRQNITAAVMALEALEMAALPAARLRRQLPETVRTFRLSGRQQWHDGLLLDTAHNAEAAAELAGVLGQLDSEGAGWQVVLGMLRDKPVKEVLAQLLPHTHTLHCTSLTVPRGLAADALAAQARSVGMTSAMQCHDTVREALMAARAQVSAEGTGRILVTGSFYTVAEALRA